MSLSAKGIRVVSAEAPVYWHVREWCEGFKKLLDYLGIDRAHIFGASLGMTKTSFLNTNCKLFIKKIYNKYYFFLGGYLAQKFAEYTSNCPRVASLILCNTFTDTTIFNNHDTANIYWMMPAIVLKKIVMGNFTTENSDPYIVEAIDFMVEKLESLTQQELASRLTLNCIKGYVEVHKLANLSVTIIDVFDEYALTSAVREELYKCYPEAKLAHLKSGGNFPYLSRSSDVNLYLQVYISLIYT